MCLYRCAWPSFPPPIDYDIWRSIFPRNSRGLHLTSIIECIILPLCLDSSVINTRNNITYYKLLGLLWKIYSFGITNPRAKVLVSRASWWGSLPRHIYNVRSKFSILSVTLGNTMAIRLNLIFSINMWILARHRKTLSDNQNPHPPKVRTTSKVQTLI